MNEEENQPTDVENNQDEESHDPETLNELFDYIWLDEEISKGVKFYAIGWVFFDIFERCRHETNRTNKQCSTAELDKFVQELPYQKIDRLINEAEQQFGEYAAEFMEDDTKQRIERAINGGVVATVKSYTTGWKTFAMNVAAGVVSGIIFAAASLGLYFYVKVDPSVNAMGKNMVTGQSSANPPPQAPH